MRVPQQRRPQVLRALRRLLIAENQGTGEITGPLAISDEEAETGAWQGPAIDGPTLAVRSGAQAIFSLDRDTVTVGREPTSDVFLDDVTVSRNHAVIIRRGEGTSLRDLGSLNGYRQPAPNRAGGGARGRRRAPDRQVPPDLSRRMTEPRLIPDDEPPPTVRAGPTAA